MFVFFCQTMNYLINSSFKNVERNFYRVILSNLRMKKKSPAQNVTNTLIPNNKNIYNIPIRVLLNYSSYCMGSKVITNA